MKKGLGYSEGFAIQARATDYGINDSLHTIPTHPNTLMLQEMYLPVS